MKLLLLHFSLILFACQKPNAGQNDHDTNSLDATESNEMEKIVDQRLPEDYEFTDDSLEEFLTNETIARVESGLADQLKEFFSLPERNSIFLYKEYSTLFNYSSVVVVVNSPEANYFAFVLLDDKGNPFRFKKLNQDKCDLSISDDQRDIADCKKIYSAFDGENLSIQTIKQRQFHYLDSVRIVQDSISSFYRVTQNNGLELISSDSIRSRILE